MLPYTQEQLDKLIAMLSDASEDQYREVLRKAAAMFRKRITPNSLCHVFKRRGLNNPTSYMRRAAWPDLPNPKDPERHKLPRFQPTGTPHPEPTAEPDQLAAQIHTVLLKTRKALTVAELSDRFDCGVGKVRAAIAAMQDQGKHVHVAGDSVEVPTGLPTESDPVRIDTAAFEGKRVRFGLTADNHLGSKYERLDVLNALFDVWEREGVTRVLCAGNMIDGEAAFNKFDLLVRGMEAQVAYFVEKWPARKGITTSFVTGDDHEGWYVQREGVDIGRFIELAARAAGRSDLEYLGHMERNITFEGADPRQVLRVMHAGGGSAYAMSYTSQKLVESLQGGEKPTIIVVGHFHKAEVCYPRSVTAIQPGCTQDQTPFLRKKRIEAHVGGMTLEFTVGKDGMFHDITTRWHPFFDRDFYSKAWAYKPLRPQP